MKQLFFLMAMLALPWSSHADSSGKDSSGNIEQVIVGAAMLAANFVAAAERAGMSRDEINAVLRNVAAHSGLEEFWITDPKGHAYLTSTDKDFTFNPDPAIQPQASAFWPLLTGTKSVVVQEPMVREIDDRKFQYIAVTGVDKPRIVSIGRSADN